MGVSHMTAPCLPVIEHLRHPSGRSPASWRAHAVSQDALVILGDDAELQAPPLGEMLIIFEKAVDQLQRDPAFARHFWQALQRRKIRNIRQLARSVELSPALQGYFRHLFAHPPKQDSRWSFSRLFGIAKRAGRRDA